MHGLLSRVCGPEFFLKDWTRGLISFVTPKCPRGINRKIMRPQNHSLKLAINILIEFYKVYVRRLVLHVSELQLRSPSPSVPRGPWPLVPSRFIVFIHLWRQKVKYSGLFLNSNKFEHFFNKKNYRRYTKEFFFYFLFFMSK